MPRNGEAISPGDSDPVATWYSSGWNRWKLRRSTNRDRDRSSSERLRRGQPAETRRRRSQRGWSAGVVVT